MSSSSSTPSIAGPQLQLDITGLTNMIGRMGAEGLKKLALAGVQPHTIGCILALESLTPASHEFRHTMRRTRKQQQSKSWYIHAIVEFGSGVNYVVDQLLCTRAGENVMALMTSILSVMDGQMAIRVLEDLFLELKAPAHSTPSLDQLTTIRTTLLPLAGENGFQERVVNMHFWFLSQFSDSEQDEHGWAKQDRSIPNMSSKWLPNQASLVQTIATLSQMSLQTSDNDKRLQFMGLRGAAWVVVYASFVLGLPTCLVHPDGRIHPVNAEYETSKVLIYPWAHITSQALYHTIRPSDLIYTADGGRPLVSDCLLKCGGDGVDLVKLLCCWDVQNRQGIGDLVLSLATEYLRYPWLSKFKSLLPRGFSPFCISDPSALQIRLRRTLSLFGCAPTVSEIIDWRQYFKVLPDSDMVDSSQLNDSFFEKIGLKPTDRVIPGCRHTDDYVQDTPTAVRDCLRCKVYECIAQMALMAYFLVFTDWGVHYRKVNSTFWNLDCDRFRTYSREFLLEFHDGARMKELGPRDAINDPRAFLINGLGFIITANPTETKEFLKFHLDDEVGWNFEGVLLTSSSLMRPQLEGGPSFMICEGEYRLSGGARPTLKGRRRSPAKHQGFHHKFLDQRLTPTDNYEEGVLEVTAELRSDSILLDYWLLSSTRIPAQRYFIPINHLLEELHGIRFWVPNPCKHDPREDLALKPAPGNVSNHEKLDDLSNIWRVGGKRKRLENDGTNHFYLWPTDRNPQAQWAALGFSSEFGVDATILQRGACLKCIRDRLNQLCRSSYAIINGEI